MKKAELEAEQKLDTLTDMYTRMIQFKIVYLETDGFIVKPSSNEGKIFNIKEQINKGQKND